MKKIDEKEIKKIRDNIKKDYGKDLHYMLLVYKGEKPNELKFTQHLETNSAEAILGILERAKNLFVTMLNRGVIGKVSKRKKKG